MPVNPFDKLKKTARVPKVKAAPAGKTVLGRPSESFTTDELKLIEVRLREFKGLQAQAIVARNVLAEVETQRLEAQVCELEAKVLEPGLPEADLKWAERRLKLLRSRCNDAWTRYTETHKLINAEMEKQRTDDPQDETLARLWLNYRSELDGMGRRGEHVGSPSPEERELCGKPGVDLRPETYEAHGVLDDAARANALRKESP